MPVVDDVGALRQGQRGSEILLDQHDGLPGVGQSAARWDESAHDRGRHPRERLSEEDELGIAEERARARQHLLLAAGKIGAAASPPLLEAREYVVDALQRPAV